MNAFEVGTQIAALVSEGKFQEAIDNFYGPEIVSVEAMEGEMQTVTGIEGVNGKTEWWESAMETHSIKVEGPYPHGDQFILIYEMDVTDKAKNYRFVMKEAALYTVKDGKIVHEKFFYTAE